MKQFSALFVALFLVVTASACGGGDAGGGDAATFCEQARALADTDPFADTGGLNGELFTETEGVLEGVIADAPGEIKDELETLLAAFRELGDIFDTYDYDFTDPDLQIAMQRFDSAALEEAGMKVDTYLEDV